MLGWWIIISTQSPEERDNSDKETKQAAILAEWEAGLFGLRWIEDMAKAGKAVKIAETGYPNRYTAQADDVLPLIENGGIIPPDNGIAVFCETDEGEDIFQPHDWGMDKIKVHADRMAACPVDQVLTIEAWDLS